MRVKWYGVKYKGYDIDLNTPILEEDKEHQFVGEVVATLPLLLTEEKAWAKCSYQFVVLLDDGSFTEVPISMCTVVKSGEL